VTRTGGVAVCWPLLCSTRSHHRRVVIAARVGARLQEIRRSAPQQVVRYRPVFAAGDAVKITDDSLGQDTGRVWELLGGWRTSSIRQSFLERDPAEEA